MAFYARRMPSTSLSTGPSTLPSTRTVALAGGADAVLVVVFVLIGRASHGEGLLGVLVTSWPFLVGLAVGWAISRAWRHPLRSVPNGIVLWAATVVVGMLLRVVSGQGVQPGFVIVTFIVLAVFLLGWRGIVAVVARSRSAKTPR